ncbi:hypothetical protein PLCT2_01032 [Planctomycetaceae bacterium]|nr:hypothetical protein PLCT2_01032 [Planctomycetaceae bacterium]
MIFGARKSQVVSQPLRLAIVDCGLRIADWVATRLRIRNPKSAIRNACLLLAALFMAACTTTKTDPDPKDEPEIKPDQEIITGELQSDFLELGPAAGVQWLSFYPDDFLEYPELFEGLDADQRRRTRLAPREGANKVLLKFDLPAGAKIKPVDWYGTECVAIDLPDAKGFTIALCAYNPTPDDEKIGWVKTQTNNLLRTRWGKAQGSSMGTATFSSDQSEQNWAISLPQKDRSDVALYGVRRIKARSDTIGVCIEVCRTNDAPISESQVSGLKSVLLGISVHRELALEGSPKHQCTSSVEDLKAGIVAYEKGGLRLALPEGWELRKSGGSSTVEIHGGGAKPLALIRKLAPKNGSLKTRVGADTVFSRRKARPDGFFGAGRALTEQEPFVIAFDYKDRSAEQVTLCVIAPGNELLTVEIISTGVIEGEARRKLRDQALEMLKAAKPSAIVANRVSDLNEIVGWKP